MLSIKRFWAVFYARNLEFFRDRSSLAWNLIFPVILVVGFAFIFQGDGKSAYKIGVLNQTVIENTQPSITFSDVKYVDYVGYSDKAKALLKLQQHELHLVVAPSEQRYWVNEESAQSYLIEKVLQAQLNGFERLVEQSQKIRYVDWVIPGVLGMNMMFSCLFGVGYVIVRYRKNHVLKRLKVTPLSAFEFICAQLVSRLFIVLFMSSIVYLGCDFMFDFYMKGSYLDLFLVAALGAMSLIALGLLVSCRSKNEELAGGLLNLATWPMMLLSGVWFSLEGAPAFVQYLAQALPLTHLVTAAREVIIEGATLSDVSYHLTVLAVMTVVFLAIGAGFFNWNTERT